MTPPLPSADEDAPLLLRAWVHDHDEAAFEALVAQQLPMVSGVCRRVLGDSQSADDAAQDALVALSRDASAIRGHPGAWLRRTALNAALRRKRQLAGPADAGADLAGGIQDAAIEDEHRLWQLAILDECVANLHEDEKDLLVAHFYLQHSQSEIARRHGVTQASISQRLRKALERLRSQMQRRGVAVRTSALLLLLAAFSGRRLDAGEAGPEAPASAWSTRVAIAAAVGVALLAGGLVVSDPGHASGPRADSHVAAAPVATHPLARRPSADGAVWLAGGSGWNPSEWEVLLGQPDNAAPEMVWGRADQDQLGLWSKSARDPTVLSWGQAVGDRSQTIVIDGIRITAFPMHGFAGGKLGGMRPRTSTSEPVRRVWVLLAPSASGHAWWLFQNDWVPVREQGRVIVYSRQSVLASDPPAGPSPQCAVIDLGADLQGFVDFATEPGVLLALPAVRRLTEAECADVRRSCMARQSGGF